MYSLVKAHYHLHAHFPRFCSILDNLRNQNHGYFQLTPGHSALHDLVGFESVGGLDGNNKLLSVGIVFLI